MYQTLLISITLLLLRICNFKTVRNFIVMNIFLKCESAFEHLKNIQKCDTCNNFTYLSPLNCTKSTSISDVEKYEPTTDALPLLEISFNVYQTLCMFI